MKLTRKQKQGLLRTAEIMSILKNSSGLCLAVYHYGTRTRFLLELKDLLFNFFIKGSGNENKAYWAGDNDYTDEEQKQYRILMPLLLREIGDTLEEF